MPVRLLCLVLMALPLIRPLSAHEPGEKGHAHDHAHPHDHDAADATPKFPRGILLPAIEGQKPWSDKPLLNDPDRFHIAIMTDHTGGHRPGIWMKAVRRLNLLRPEFVMSVGDLIEGYSNDRHQVEAEWKEFLGFVDHLDMRFFFVAGNHDLTNPLMHQIWREHFGPEWYSFDYRGVHFMCLCSEDPENHIGDEQLAWIRKDLEEHADARWTLLFFHKPMWVTAERAIAAGNPDPTNWRQVEEMLGSRPHTVFAGHVHHYVQYDRRGMKYYHLATTGGGSRLRGVPHGEFDHVVWLTMENDGPTVVNLLLDGILPADEVTEEGIARFRDFLAQTRIEIAPILLDDAEGFSRGQIDLRFTNGFETPVRMTGRIDGLPLKGLTVDQPALSLTAGPGETAELSVQVQFNQAIAFEHLAQTLLTAKLSTLEEDRPLTAEKTVPVIIDRGYPCPGPPSAVTIDGVLDEWPALPLATGEQPLVIGPAEQWQGPGDASLSFAVAQDEQFLYFAGQVTDDAVMEGDDLELRLDARPIDARKDDPRLVDGTYLARMSAPSATGEARLEVKGMGVSADGVKYAARRTEAGYDVELALPRDWLTRAQGAAPRGFQCTPVLVDVDQPDEAACRIIWRGTADVDQRNTNYGQFVLNAAGN
jgi:hypothetical protein